MPVYGRWSVPPPQPAPGPAVDAIQSLTEQWFSFEDEADPPLADFLGMTPEQFGRWTAGLMSGDELQDWADAHGIEDTTETGRTS